MDERELKEMKIKLDDTHKMVSKLYKFEKNRRFWRVLKFIAFAVIIVGAYFTILPVFNKVLDTYNSLSNGVTNIQNIQFPWQSDTSQAE